MVNKFALIILAGLKDAVRAFSSGYPPPGALKRACG